MTANTKFKPRDWIVVPLRDDGFGVGRIARVGECGILFGYFFPCRFSKIPSLGEISSLSASDSILLAVFGDHRIRIGLWPVLVSNESWNENDWPLPPLARIDEKGKKAWRVRYSESDLKTIISEGRCSLEEAASMPRETLMGAAALEIRLTRLLKELSPTVQ